MEGDGLAVRRRLPALGEHADRLAAAIEIDQVFLDLAADDVDAGRCLQARIELPLLGSVMHVEHAALARRVLREGAQRIDDVGGDRGRGQKRRAAVDFETGQIHQTLLETAKLIAARNSLKPYARCEIKSFLFAASTCRIVASPRHMRSIWNKLPLLSVSAARALWGLPRFIANCTCGAADEAGHCLTSRQENRVNLV